MRTALLFSSLVLAVGITASAQTPAQPKPVAPAPARPAAPAQQAPQAKPPAPAQPAPQSKPPAPARRATQPAGRSGMAITVTDGTGATIPEVQVELMGPTNRNGQTNGSGQINFPGLQAGTYRLRFTGDEVTSFEREVTLRAGQIADLDITLTPAPKKEEPPPQVTLAPAAPPTGPTGEVQTASIPDLLEKEFVGKQPRRETLLSCSGDLRTTMIQLNEPMPDRLYADADATYYVLGGEGAVRLNGKETQLRTNGFVSVPRGTTHSFTRRGGRPFVLLAVLGGEPCEEAK